MANNYASDCPHKDRHTRVCVCLCVCMLGLIDESFRTACSTGGIITAGAEQLRSRLFAMSHTHLLARTHTHTHVRTSTCMMPQCTSSQKEHHLPVFYNVMVSYTTAQPHQSHGVTTLSFCSASYENTNYEKSPFVPPKIKSYRKYTQIISGRHDREEKQTIIPEAFPNLESIYGKGGGKGTQPLWVKGFRSCFNRLDDIRAVRQKSWSGVST